MEDLKTPSEQLQDINKNLAEIRATTEGNTVTFWALMNASEDTMRGLLMIKTSLSVVITLLCFIIALQILALVL